MKTRLALLSVGLVSTALGFDLVRDGRLAVRVDCGGSAEEQFAKAEFLRIMDAVTGCGTNESATAAGRIVIKVVPKDDESFSIATSGTTMTLAGSNPHTAMFAMWEVLEGLGVRWYWPGEDGEYLPARTKDLAVADLNVSQTAGIRYRGLDNHGGKRGMGLAKTIYTRHRRLHRPTRWGGHSFGQIRPPDCKDLNEYFAKYPEQFMMKKDGTRSKDQHCYTSPETLKTFVDFIVRVWDEHPETEIVNLAPMDCPECCKCPDCAKMDSSTCFFSFVNRIIEGVEKVRPGKRYSTIAYSFYLNPPKVSLHPALCLDYCMYNRCYKHCFSDETCPRRDKPEKAMDEWKAVLGHAPGVYGYHCDTWSYQNPTVAPLGRVLQDEIRWARDYGVEEWHTEWYCGEGSRKPGSKEPAPRSKGAVYAHRFMVYAATRLLWEPDLDYMALKRDWCERVYGPAAEPMRKYMSALETAWAKDTKHIWYYGNDPQASMEHFITSDLVRYADAQFAAAAELLKASPDARAAGEVALEREFWEKWRTMRVTFDLWRDRQEKPDEQRIAKLMDAPLGRQVYPPKGMFKPEELEDMWSKGKLWGKRAGAWTGGGVVNCELSLDFLYPDTAKHDFLEFHLRCGRERFGIPYRWVVANFTHQIYGAYTSIQHGKSSGSFPRTKFNAPLAPDTWHHLVLRLADTKLRATLDGTVLYTTDVPVGAGFVDVFSYTTGLKFRNVQVHELDESALGTR